MNYTHTENLPPFGGPGGNGGPLGPDFNSNSPWINNYNGYANVDANGQPFKLTPENLFLNEKDDCDLIEGHIFSHGDIKREFGVNEKVTNFNQVNPQKESLNDFNLTMDFATNSNSSDKSSPSTTIFNQQSSKPEIQVIASQNYTQDEETLTEKEIANRRKAQNRAAQRAFRERKEMKLKELEEKLNKSESDKNLLLKQLEELKKQNIVISTENKLLLENGSNLPVGVDSGILAQDEKATFQFPLGENFYNGAQALKTSNHLTNPEIPYDQKRLTITETWEYLNEREDSDELEIGAIMDMIRGLEVCHEHGPAYPLKTIDAIIREFSQKK